MFAIEGRADMDLSPQPGQVQPNHLPGARTGPELKIRSNPDDQAIESILLSFCENETVA
jgi:hypothetical protein